MKSKRLYALGSVLNNFPKGVKEFRESKGWEGMRACVDPMKEGVECQKRVAFFISNYLAEEDVDTEGIQENGFLDGFVLILGDEKYSHKTDLLEKVSILLS